MARWLFLVMVLLVACGREEIPRDLYDASIVVPTPTYTPSPPPLGVVGQRIESEGIALTVLDQLRSAQVSDFQVARVGSEYLIVEVLIETTTRETAPYNPLYFMVKDSSGFEYSGITSSNLSPLKSGDLARGEKARGTVAFEVPIGASGLTLSYDPLFGRVAPIRVALG
jgi:hypothetical protein